MKARIATVVLCGADGVPVGSTGPLSVATPWWMEVAPVVEAVEARFGVRPTILRLLDAAGPPHGGAITYLAEVDRVPAGLVGWSGDLDDHPLRMAWARPGGPAADGRWAAERLDELGRPLVAEPEQLRTWNLSSLWRLPTASGPAWLKAVPPFFAHEPAVLRVLDHRRLPELLAGEPGRSLLAHVPGTDGYGAGVDGWRELIDTLVSVQGEAVDRIDELTAAGTPHVTLRAVVQAAADVVARRAGELTEDEQDRLAALLAEADRGIDVVNELGPPETLVHGDAHPGNGRFSTDGVTILDWGDAFVGQPLLDLAVAESYSADLAPLVIDAWLERWRAAGVRRVHEAWAALRPLARLRAAVVFQAFVDAIEPSERPYHESDVVPALRSALP